MKSPALPLAAFLFGILVAWSWHHLKREFVTVRVIDRQDCADPEYYLEMVNQTISVKGDQIGQTDTQMMAAKFEAFIYAAQVPSLQGEVRYRLRASYSDCADVLGDERVAKEGWILYETIEGGSIDHVVRSK